MTFLIPLQTFGRVEANYIGGVTSSAVNNSISGSFNFGAEDQNRIILVGAYAGIGVSPPSTVSLSGVTIAGNSDARSFIRLPAVLAIQMRSGSRLRTSQRERLERSLQALVHLDLSASQTRQSSLTRSTIHAVSATQSFLVARLDRLRVGQSSVFPRCLDQPARLSGPASIKTDRAAI